MSELREIIREQCAAVKPYDSLEKEHIADILDWIDSGAPLFRVAKPDKPPKHLVSYFVVIDPGQHSVLLCDHRKAQLWLPTGGHVLPNEHPRDAVSRESLEELNRPAVFLRGNDRPFFITINQTVGLTPGHTDVSLWYLVRGSTRDYVHYDKREMSDVEWYSFAEILETDSAIFDRHMQRFVHKLKKYLEV